MDDGRGDWLGRLFPNWPGSLRRVGGGGGGGGDRGFLAMNVPETEAAIAAEVVYEANDGVSDFIVAQAQERLRALQVAAHALDQRVTQVAAFQFAAAAFAAGAAASDVLRFFASLSAIAFVVGGVVAFRGIRSDPIHLPGIAPAWWKGSLEVKPFELDTARAWAADVLQNAIEQVDNENCERARHLNLSLNYAVGGAVLVAIGSALRLFGSL